MLAMIIALTRVGIAKPVITNFIPLPPGLRIALSGFGTNIARLYIRLLLLRLPGRLIILIIVTPNLLQLSIFTLAFRA
jgi:hypothetical protein